MSGGLGQRWRDRGGRTVRLWLPFADIMEVALALLALTPDELAALGWGFDERKRVLGHFLASGKQADALDRDTLDTAIITIRLPLRDVRRLQDFARRELPKRASRAAVIDRLDTVIDDALGERR